MDTISKELIKAYFKATFRVVDDKNEIILKPNVKSEDVVRLHSKHQVSTSALITAYNPYSEDTQQSINESAQTELIEVVAQQWKTLNGEGFDPAGAWKSEPSILVLGVGIDEAINIGKQFNQNAILFISQDGIPKLYECNNGELL